MAEQIVCFIVEKIADQLIEEANSLSSVHDHFEWIEAELRRMRCFLKDADMKQDFNERIRNWVTDVRDVAYDTEDVIDTYILKAALQRRKGLVMFIKSYTCFFAELIFRHRVNGQIHRIKTRIRQISESRSAYGIENIGRGRDDGTSFEAKWLQEKRRSSPHNIEEDIVGFVEDLRALRSRVIEGESTLSVISIVGMAGLGKTTLAKKIYRSSDVNKHFDCCCWVYVSQEYEAKDTLHDLGKKILGLGKADLERMMKEDLVELLSTFLEDKRYFIVLDDIWQSEVWYDLKAAFPDRNNGSRIMLTTRSKGVAMQTDPTSPPHELCLLNDDESWELFSRKVFLEWKSSKSSLPPWSEELGKQIVQRCGGLPLAIVVMGGVLSRKEATFSEWLKVLQSMHWQLVQEPAQCADILALSYCDLPYHLKPCFLYFCLFPEDFEISARRLILLWVAEGFVQPRGQEPLEDVAEDYLEELIGRNVIQVAKRKSNGRIKTCRVHDLLRELSMSKAKEEQFLSVFHEESNAGSLKRARRLALHFGFPSVAKNAYKFRSLLCFDLAEPLFREMKKFKLLRILDLEGVPVARLHSAIGNFIHLRYLGLRETWLKKLPSSLCYLSNLQTLDLRSTLISPIPVVIWEMQQLRHLYFNEMKEMVVNPPKTKSALPPPLANLQTLQGICISQASRVENGLDKLTNLRELGLLGEFNLHEEAVTNWISKSKNLECLKLQARTRFGHNNNVTGFPRSMTFSSHLNLYKLHLEGFQSEVFELGVFPPNLSELTLRGSLLMEDPMPKLEKLPNLRILKLKESSYVGKQLTCTGGGFPQLQFLKLSFLYATEAWRIEEGAMPNLKQLEIVNCKRLKIVPRGLQPVSSLRELKLGYMPFDYEAKVQEREGENWYRIQYVLPV